MATGGRSQNETTALLRQTSYAGQPLTRADKRWVHARQRGLFFLWCELVGATTWGLVAAVNMLYLFIGFLIVLVVIAGVVVTEWVTGYYRKPDESAYHGDIYTARARVDQLVGNAGVQMQSHYFRGAQSVTGPTTTKNGSTK